VLIPEENAKDLADIPDNVKNNMEIVPVSRMGEVIKHALVRRPEPIEWDGTVEDAKVPAVESTDEGTGAIAH
jgi:ATP-dependent Lon protease